MFSITNNLEIKKNNIAPSSPTPLYISLFLLISSINASVVFLLSSICLALVFVCSKLLINSILSNIVASSASDNFLKTSSSLLINSASNSLISVTYFLIDSSNSGCSILTTIANN